MHPISAFSTTAKSPRARSLFGVVQIEGCSSQGYNNPIAMTNYHYAFLVELRQQAGGHSGQNMVKKCVDSI